MPNLRPPITTTASAIVYREAILKALPPSSDFTPLMTLYLTDSTSSDEIKLASESNLCFCDFENFGTCLTLHNSNGFSPVVHGLISSLSDAACCKIKQG